MKKLHKISLLTLVFFLNTTNISTAADYCTPAPICSTSGFWATSAQGAINISLGNKALKCPQGNNYFYPLETDYYASNSGIEVGKTFYKNSVPLGIVISKNGSDHGWILAFKKLRINRYATLQAINDACNAIKDGGLSWYVPRTTHFRLLQGISIGSSGISESDWTKLAPNTVDGSIFRVSDDGSNLETTSNQVGYAQLGRSGNTVTVTQGIASGGQFAPYLACVAQF